MRFNDALDAYAKHLNNIEAKYADRIVGQMTVVKSQADNRSNLSV